jgi:putative flippase GtrA
MISQIAAEFRNFLQQKFVRFCIVGGLAFLIDAGSARGLVMFLRPMLAVSGSYLLACIFHYTLSKCWTFGGRHDNTPRRIASYALVNLITLLVNTALSMGMLRLLHGNIILAKTCALPPTSVLGFVLLRKFVFSAHPTGGFPCEDGR